MSAFEKVLAVLVAVATIAAPQPLTSQEDTPPPEDGPTACAGPESHRFDFWAGTWDLSGDFAEWEHAISRDGGETWQATWRMTFRRREGVEMSTAGPPDGAGPGQRRE